ncbi:MAG TPA: MFS transporter [Gemmataceae bacterium]|jgi:NNP family nitrate/nitrite transporter-like MFS transporter
MNLRDFRRAGHFPTLVCAFLYFDVSFMVWVLIGSLGVSISAQLQFDPVTDAAKKGFMVALPLLGGSLLRLVLGLLTDHIGARRTAILGMVLTSIPLLLGWLWADSYSEVLLVGLLLGVAGASFAAALPLASRWYPPRYQGLAMGIAGAGNSGTALATFFGPLLARSLGWHAVFGLALVPLSLTLFVFVLLAKDSPTQPPARALRDYGSVLGYADTWWFCLLYAVTFGGFVGLASFLTIFFKDQYFPLDAATGEIYAGYITTLCVVSGSFLRPVGGHLADRFGGIRMLMLLYVGAGIALLALTTLPSLPVAIVLLFGVMGMLGMGNGSVFQLVPQRFPREIGVVTGLVGAAGGIGGFLLPNVLGKLKQETASFAPGFVVFALMACLCAIVLWRLRPRWESEFLASTSPFQPSTDEETFIPANASGN